MGLEQFTSGSDDNNTSSSESTNDESRTSQETTSKPDFGDGWQKADDRSLERLGPYGYGSHEEFQETIEGEIELDSEKFRDHMPIFPVITQPPGYTRGRRYKHPDNKTTITCVSKTNSKLCLVNREMVMMDCGSTEKEDCIEELSQRFGESVGPETDVALHIFAKIRHVVKMAMSDEFVDQWSTENKERVFKAIYGESYTQHFRDKDTSGEDLKHINHISEW